MGKDYITEEDEDDEDESVNTKSSSTTLKGTWKKDHYPETVKGEDPNKGKGRIWTKSGSQTDNL